MSILLVSKSRDFTSFREAMIKTDPDLNVEIWPHVEKPERVQFAVAWNHPKHIFESYPNLKVISSLGAGADHLLQDETIPNHIQFTKVYDPTLTLQMKDYVYSCVLSILLKIDFYRNGSEWDPQHKYTRDQLTVGVMGLGNIGSRVAMYLADHGFSVYGLSKTQKKLTNVHSLTPHKSNEFFNQTNILVNLLPLTAETEGMIDLNLLKKLRKPSFLIHVGRGSQLVEEDLIYALDTNNVEAAYLDVFSEEPLPGSHPFWNRENIHITPHIAAISNPENVAESIVENYKRLLSGIELMNLVDFKKGY